MPIVAVVVGAIGTAVGTAIGTAIGGTILGVSAATIGGVIGAGIAGGALASATGGSFGKGFLMGATGAAIGGFLKAGLGDTVGGATQQFADGTTTAEMLAAQGGAEFAPDAFSGMGDIGATGASVGFGELGGTDAISGAETYGLGGIDAPVGTELGATTPAWEQGLQDTVNMDQFGAMSNGTSLANSAGFGATPTPSLGSEQFAMTPGMAAESSLLSSDYSFAPEMSTSTGIEGMGGSAGGLENIGQGYVQAPDGTTSAQMLQSQGGADFAPNNPPQGLGGTIKNMANTSDQWLKSTFGQGAPTTGKLLMGGGQFLMDQYNIHKQQQQAKGLAPMSFEQYQQKFTNPEDYRTASRQLAQSGRTGTLPALLARMKERARQGYAGYLPGAKKDYYDVQSGVQANRNASLSRLFNNMGYGT